MWLGTKEIQLVGAMREVVMTRMPMLSALWTCNMLPWVKNRPVKKHPYVGVRVDTIASLSLFFFRCRPSIKRVGVSFLRVSMSSAIFLTLWYLICWSTVAGHQSMCVLLGFCLSFCFLSFRVCLPTAAKHLYYWNLSERRQHMWFSARLCLLWKAVSHVCFL